ncbi:MAG: sugar phosphate isomerase/epimerase [Ruminococcaceae bacterium]|nr:sugar phosphate isomerase/epimerase [Oscillospiraceae bacterium]
MKLSISCCRLDWLYGTKGAIDFLKTTGFEAVDFDLRRGKKAPYPTEEEISVIIGDACTALKENGILCNQAHGPFGMKETGAWDMTNAIFARTVRSFFHYARLGAKYVVVHPVGRPDGSDEIPVNVEMYKALLPYAKQAGVKIATENVFHITMQTPEKVNRLLDTVNDEDLVFCFDTGHSTVVGTAPEDFIAGVNPKYLQVLHLHDNDGVHDRHMLPYTGVMKWDKIIAALKAANYKGDVNLEIPLYIEGMFKEAMPRAITLAAKVAEHIREELLK